MRIKQILTAWAAILALGCSEDEKTEPSEKTDAAGNTEPSGRTDAAEKADAAEQIDAAVIADAALNAGKSLMVYYSYTNHCHEIATALKAQIEADVMRIEPADKTQKYEENNYAIGTALLNAINAAPDDPASYPAIDPVAITDLSPYKNIFVVTPLWWSQMAAITQTYLFNYGPQMADKNVAMIVSSHSSSIKGVISNAERLIPNAIWMGDALWIDNQNHKNRATLIQNWLQTLDFAE